MKTLGEGTPGPWEYHAQGDANDYCLLTHEKQWVISFRQNGELMTAKQKANARLISKAPLLIEARDVLARIVECCEKEPDSTCESCGHLARALLAKLDSE